MASITPPPKGLKPPQANITYSALKKFIIDNNLPIQHSTGGKKNRTVAQVYNETVAYLTPTKP